MAMKTVPGCRNRSIPISLYDCFLEKNPICLQVSPRNSSSSRARQIVILEVPVPRAKQVFDFRNKVVVALAGAGLVFQNRFFASCIHDLRALMFLAGGPLSKCELHPLPSRIVGAR